MDQAVPLKRVQHYVKSIRFVSHENVFVKDIIYYFLVHRQTEEAPP